MTLDIIAIVVSSIATTAAVIALVFSIVSKKNEAIHSFYSQLEKNISEILFGRYPKLIDDYIDLNERMIKTGLYEQIDDVIHDLFLNVSCLDYLDDGFFNEIEYVINDVEDILMVLKNDGYNDQKIEFFFKKNKNLYKILKEFVVKR